MRSSYAAAANSKFSATKLLQKIDLHYEERLSFVQSIMGATDRRRDGGTMAVAAGMVKGVLMLEVWSPGSRR